MTVHSKTASLFVFGIILMMTATCAHTANRQGIHQLGYAIQMGAFSDVKNAERFTGKLQAKGIEAFYFRKDNGVYAVRFGDFTSKEKARSSAKKLIADRLIDSYYIAPPNEIVFGRPVVPAWKNPPPEEIRTSRVPLRNDSDKKIKEPSSSKTTTSIDTSQKPSHNGEGTRDMGGIAARTAERFVGIPYRWGGENVVDGMDCSGFVRAVYNLCGISIPRTSRDQFKAGDPISKDGLRDGDLVFFGAAADKINHVGIYVGNGRFVHAPKRGEDIRVTSIDDNYFDKRFIGARRYFQ